MLYVGSLISVLGKIEKIQKNCTCYDDSDSINGAWLIHDASRQGIIMLGMDGHTLYWEKVFEMRPDYEKDVYDKVEASAKLEDNAQLFPCKILNKDLSWIIARLKSYSKNDRVWLEDVVRDGDKCKIVLHTYSKDELLEIPARAEDKGSLVENMLYYKMVRHENGWEKSYAPMEIMGWKTRLSPNNLKLVADLMATKDGRKNEDVISLSLYGFYGEDKSEEGVCRKYIEQNHWEILDDEEGVSPSRGVICMIVREPEEYRRHYI